MCRLAWLCLMVFSSLVAAQEAVDWSNIVSKVSPAVVTIVSADAKDIAQGSGFIISSDGKIVTNFHVIEGKTKVLARRSDGSFLAITGVLAVDESNDLVILKADGRNLPFVALGDSDAVKVGEAICVIGSPMALEGTVSTGIVSAIRELKGGRKLLQITAPISEGSSGSPVFNRKGEVIGIASFYLAQGQNLNFAVPVNELKALLEQAASKPKQLEKRFVLSPSSVMRALEQTFSQSLQVAKSIKDASLRSLAFCYIAEMMAKAGQKEKAVTIFDRALQVAKGIKDVSSRSSALYDIVQAMAKVGFFDRALQVAKGIKDASSRSSALYDIAEEMAKAGVRNQDLWNQSLQVAKSIENTYSRSSTLRDIAKAMAEAGLFDQSLQVAKGIKDAFFRSSAFFVIAEAMAEAGQKEKAIAIFDQALQVAKDIRSAYPRLLALCHIAEAMAKAGQKEKAVTIFDQALQIAKSIQDISSIRAL
ncbi:MAG: trypsin-like peptidase domain-containing protein [Armatimonadetes bacterium]|nr:trypsin-like peptidase domain-containing protein [Armatimonadota bacterium]MDW8026794.1 trypsin-like peptidase domain-containing protein [Armatimonadota bacterium]